MVSSNEGTEKRGDQQSVTVSKMKTLAPSRPGTVGGVTSGCWIGKCGQPAINQANVMSLVPRY